MPVPVPVLGVLNVGGKNGNGTVLLGIRLSYDPAHKTLTVFLILLARMVNMLIKLLRFAESHQNLQ